MDKSQIGKLKVVYQDIDMVEVVEGVGEIFAMGCRPEEYSFAN